MVLAIAAHCQNITINNSSACSIQYYVTATDAGCTSYASSITYVIPPNSSVTFNFGTITWQSPPSFVPTQWAFFKGGNFCGPYNWSFLTCPSPLAANDNVIVMGIPCTGFGTTNCANMNNACNTCTWIRASFTVFGGNTIVNIG